MQLPHDLIQAFKSHFHSLPYLFSSPGRINLIGEHTDYNNGLVLPAAIDKYIYLAIGKREDNEIHLYSIDYDESHTSSLSTIRPSGKLWPDYLLGVIDQIQRNGSEIAGINVAFGGDIPQGAGLSSSAAIECAMAFGLNQVFNLGYTSLEMVKIGQAAENNFVGVQCGIMDQFASVFGKKDNLIKLDCETEEYTYIPFDIRDYSILLFDTQVKHSLAFSAYNERRRECEKGVHLIQKHHPHVHSLRQVTAEMLEKYVCKIDQVVYRRCNFVINEIQRLQEACNDLLAKDFYRFGQRMFETHEGLRDFYEVSCAELDFLVNQAKEYPEVLGARMMGGGFGGCTINLIKTSAIDKVSEEITNAYKMFNQKELKIYRVTIENGTQMISQPSELLKNNPFT